MTDRQAPKACCIPRGSKSHIRAVNDSCETRVTDRPCPLTELVANSACIGDDWFDMGCSLSPHPEDGEGPVRSVWVDSFGIAKTAVSNREFQCFIDATGYKTEAECAGSSFVFFLLLDKAVVTHGAEQTPWWRDVAEACWHRPEGAGSSLAERWDHPVVHITRNDAIQYCRWSGARLATEAEWEYAARGGLASQPYPWGDELYPDDEYRCNIWQGTFPNNNSGADGYVGTAPVKAYTANQYGLFNMTGNVWEWVADRFTNRHSPRQIKNPKGPLNGDNFVAKGGSYLCHESYCLRYRTSSRQSLSAGVSAGNLGFRVAFNMPIQKSIQTTGVIE